MPFAAMEGKIASLDYGDARVARRAGWPIMRRVLSNTGVLVAWMAAGLRSASIALGATSAPSNWRHVSWTAPQNCPTEATVRAAVEAMVGVPSLMDSGSDVTAEGVVKADVRGFTLQARVERDGVSESKTIAAASCATLADAYAVIVAFAIDPSAEARVAEPAPPAFDADSAVSPTHEGPARAIPPGIRATLVAPSAPMQAPLMGVGPFLATAAGLLPLPAIGVGGRLSLEAGPRWEIGATYWPQRPASTALSAPQALRAMVGLASAQPAVCGSVWRRVAGGAAAVCVGAEVGAMYATGTGLPATRTGTSLWVAPTSSVELAMRLARGVDLRFRLDIGVPLFPPSFVVDHVGPGGPVEVYRPLPVFGVVSVEPEVRFFSTDSDAERHNRK
jgi:hypothetical protein